MATTGETGEDKDPVLALRPLATQNGGQHSEVVDDAAEHDSDDAAALGHEPPLRYGEQLVRRRRKSGWRGSVRLGAGAVTGEIEDSRRVRRVELGLEPSQHKR